MAKIYYKALIILAGKPRRSPIYQGS